MRRQVCCHHHAAIRPGHRILDDKDRMDTMAHDALRSRPTEHLSRLVAMNPQNDEIGIECISLLNDILIIEPYYHTLRDPNTIDPWHGLELLG